jgi:hypothetical protein
MDEKTLFLNSMEKYITIPTIGLNPVRMSSTCYSVRIVVHLSIYCIKDSLEAKDSIPILFLFVQAPYKTTDFCFIMRAYLHDFGIVSKTIQTLC